MNMEINDIIAKTKEIIEESCGIDADTISLEDTMFNKLEIDSIDLVDILFELESEYDIELKLSDLEKKTQDELKGLPYEIDGIITTEGLKSLQKNMTEIDPSKFKEGLTVHELFKLFTVHSLCKLVIFQLEEK